MQNIAIISTITMLAYFTEKHRNKKYLFLTFLVLALFCGLRGRNIGSDTPNYISFFYDVQHFGILYGSDIGFSLISYILMFIFGEPQILFLIYATITNYLIVYRLWDFEKKASFATMILVYTIIYYPYCFNIVRQFLAISMIFWATKYLEKNQIIKYIILNLVAISFHSSAIICFVYLFFNRKFIKWITTQKFLNNKTIIIIMTSGLILLLLIFAKYLHHFTNMNINIHGMVLMKLFFVFLIIYLNNPISDKKFDIMEMKKHISIDLKTLLFYFIGLLLSCLGMFFSFMNRIGFYFLMYEMPFWGQAVRTKKNKRIHIAMITIILLYYVLSFLLLN